MKKLMLICAPVTSRSGYGSHARDLVTSFKNLITKEIQGEDENGKPTPVISMITSVQSNRSGVVTNRRPENILNDESIVSLSDRIIQYCSHMFHLRVKVAEEIQEENAQFGNCVLEKFKCRHLGTNVQRALGYVEKDDGSKVMNHINLEMDNFSIVEVGDLQDQVEAMSLGGQAEEDGEDEGVDL